MDAPFPIVGVGASAGGVEALEACSAPCRPTSASPSSSSPISAPSGKACCRRSWRATPACRSWSPSTAAVQRDHVYVLPADAVLHIEKGHLRLRAVGDRERKPIDIFFASLAEDQGEYAIGIVLSGSGSDGTLGIKAIKEHGGLTLAQASDGSGPRPCRTCRPAPSPRGLVDLACRSRTCRRSSPAMCAAVELLNRSRRGPTSSARDRSGKAICAILRDQTGHDFSRLQEQDLLRRVAAAHAGAAARRARAYVARSARGPGEVDALFRDLLIGVTNFFRDAEAFEALDKLVLPQLFEGKRRAGHVRVWVPGCATGEEAYSIAILLREQAEPSSTALPSCRSSPPTSTRPRWRSRAPAAIRTPLLDGVSPERLGALLHRRRRRATSSPRRSATCALLPAQRDPRPAVLAHRPDLLPQPADLPRQRAAGPGDPDVPLRAEAGRLPVPRHVGEHRPARRPVRPGRQEAPHLPRAAATGSRLQLAACWSSAARRPAAGDAGPRRAGAAAGSPAQAVEARVLDQFAAALSW